jgi:prepilin signal peptidase PulO-like enzyme (type II secretory pathway)
LLIIIFVYDLKHFIILDKIIFPAIAITVLYRLFGILNFSHWPLIGTSFQWIEIGNFLGAAFAASLFFLAIVLVSKGRWMGMGDVKLAFLMGLFLGFPNILAALFFAFFIGAIIGVGLILAKKKTLKSEVPFGPFLVVGTFIALFWGERIINWYLNLFRA